MGNRTQRLNYIEMNVVLWGAVQEIMKGTTHLKHEIAKLKGTGKGDEKGERKGQ